MSRRRRGRLVTAVLVLLLLLAAACVGGELYARSRLASELRDALPGLSEDASVTPRGLVLVGLARGSLQGVEVDASSLRLLTDVTGTGTDAVASVTLQDAAIDVEDVALASPHEAASLDLTGTLGWEELASLVSRAAPDLPEPTVSAGGEEGTLAVSTSLLGVGATLTLRPSVSADGGLSLEVTGASLGGQPVDLDSEVAGQGLSTWLGLDGGALSVTADSLPTGLALSDVAVTDGGLRLTVGGDDVALGSLGS